MHLYIACEDFLQSLVICQQTHVILQWVWYYATLCFVLFVLLPYTDLILSFSLVTLGRHHM